MNIQDIRALVFHNQHITNPVQSKQVVKDMCGLQAQFFNHPRFALKVRSVDYEDALFEEQMIKTWTLRGTLHMIHEEDFPMFMAVHRLPTWFDKYNADIDLDRIAGLVESYLKNHPTITRKQLGVLMEEANFTSKAIEVATNAWGGIFMKLCHEGKLVFSGVCERDFKCKEPFSEMLENDAKRELLLRYFTNYGPATINDAAYFTKFKKREILAIVRMLPLQQCEVENRVYYYVANKQACKPIPEVLFLGCFDPLLLGYEKKESLFLKKEHIRGIFNLTGIVFAPILYNGMIIGRWKANKKVMECSMFENITKKQQQVITDFVLKGDFNCKEVVFIQFAFV